LEAVLGWLLSDGDLFAPGNPVGSPIGLPVGIGAILEFSARHNITPQTEHSPMRRINEAFEPLEAGNARYRIVLDVDV
jgi:uncharacterized zinc-type alcohol dehydrogenase-like protein